MDNSVISDGNNGGNCSNGGGKNSNDNNSNRATRAVICQANLEHNLAQIRGALRPGVRLCVAVKANGYGCSAVNTARTAVNMGAKYLAVATVGEGAELRANGITCAILLMSMCAPDEVPDAVRLGLTPFVFDRGYIEDFARAVKKSGLLSGSEVAISKPLLHYPVHLAVDTGMGRIGCMPDEAAQLAAFINSTKSLAVGGMCTHFAVADSTTFADREFTQGQIARFTQAVESVKLIGINPGICHCAESVALFDLPQAQMDMVRAGIVTYGYYPGGMTREYFAQKGTPVDLRPVMAVETEVCTVRRFHAGQSISYGRTWIASHDTDIAVLPIGYADGILRRWTPCLEVAINGRAYPVVGRICMDQCMVDVGTAGAVHRGDKVIVFGDKSRGALLDADDIAHMTGTISYEVMTGITSRVPRVVV